MHPSTSRRWLRAADAHLDDLRSVLDQRTDAADCPHAARLLNDVPVYDCEALRARLSQGGDFQRSLMAEWAWVWEDGPGILVLQGALSTPVVDAVTARGSRRSTVAAANVALCNACIGAESRSSNASRALPSIISGDSGLCNTADTPAALARASFAAVA
mgnify:CR=1 FL=1